MQDKETLQNPMLGSSVESSQVINREELMLTLLASWSSAHESSSGLWVGGGMNIADVIKCNHRQIVNVETLLACPTKDPCQVLVRSSAAPPF